MSSGITHNSIVLLKSYQWCRNTKSLEKAVPHSLILKSNQRYYTKMNSIELQYLQYISAAQNKFKKKKKKAMKLRLSSDQGGSNTNFLGSSFLLRCSIVSGNLT